MVKEKKKEKDAFLKEKKDKEKIEIELSYLVELLMYSHVDLMKKIHDLEATIYSEDQ